MEEYLVDFLKECGIGTIENRSIPKGFSEEIAELVQTKYFANSKSILMIMKLHYVNFLSYSEIGFRCQMSETQAYQMFKRTISRMNGYLVSENFICLLARYHIQISGSLTADLLKKYLEKQKRYEQYRNIKIAELNLSEKTYFALYRRGYTNMQELLSKDILDFQNDKYFSKKEYSELLFAIVGFFHEYQHDTAVTELKDILALDYPNNFLIHSGIRNISGTFSESGVQQTEKILLCCFRQKHMERQNAERNLIILKQRYQQKMTLAAIAGQHSLCRERVSQILQRARQFTGEIIYSENFLSVLYEEMQNERITVSDAMIDKCFFDMKYRKQESADLIEYTDLSVFSKNILWRSGYKTIEEVIQAGAESIRNIRSIGKVHFKEIADAMIKHGANPKEWRGCNED